MDSFKSTTILFLLVILPLVLSHPVLPRLNSVPINKEREVTRQTVPSLTLPVGPDGKPKEIGDLIQEGFDEGFELAFGGKRKRIRPSPMVVTPTPDMMTETPTPDMMTETPTPSIEFMTESPSPDDMLGGITEEPMPMIAPSSVPVMQDPSPLPAPEPPVDQYSSPAPSTAVSSPAATTENENQGSGDDVPGDEPAPPTVSTGGSDTAVANVSDESGDQGGTPPDSALPEGGTVIAEDETDDGSSGVATLPGGGLAAGAVVEPDTGETVSAGAAGST